MDGTISPIGYDGMTIGSRSGFAIGYLVDIWWDAILVSDG